MRPPGRAQPWGVRLGVVALLGCGATASTGMTGAPRSRIGSPPDTCRPHDAGTVTLTGPQGEFDRRRDLATGTVIDARTASWTGTTAVPIRFGREGDICLVGALVHGTFPDTTSWAAMHDTYAILPFGPRAIVQGVRVHNYGDGISPRANADRWVLRDSWFSFIRDDCIENDNQHTGLVENVLFDGCYVFYSARRPSGWTAVDGAAHTVTFRNVLVRLQPMPTVYKGVAPGHGKFWKLDADGTSPQIALSDVVFRVDQPAGIGGGYMRMIPPADKLAQCTNVTLVWLGDGDFPEPVPPCFTLTRDRARWDGAVAAWHAAHPHVRDTLGAVAP